MNRSNSSPIHGYSTEGAFRTATVIFIANLLSASGWLYISIKFGGWQLYLLTGLLAVFSIVAAIAMRLIRRGKAEAGGWIITSGVMILLAVGAFLYTGVALLAGVSVIILANLVANQMLTPKTQKQVLTLSIVAGILVAFLDQSKSEYRLFIPEIQSILPIITGLATLLLVFFIARQSRELIATSLLNKLLLSFIAMLIVLSLGTVVFNFYSTTQRINAEEEKDLTRLQVSIQNQVDGLQQLSLALATEMANNPEVQAAFASGNREHLAEITLPTFLAVQSKFNVKQYQFLLPPATSFLRLHQLDKFGDDLTSIRATVVQANSSQEAVSGIEIGRGGLGVRGVSPITYREKHIGVVDVGIDIGQPFLDDLKKEYGVDVQIMLDKKAAQAATFQGAVSEQPGPNQNLLFQAGTNANPIFSDTTVYPRVMNGETVVSKLKTKDRSYSIISFPIKDFSGNTIGVMEIVSDSTVAIAKENQTLLQTILISLAAILLSLLLVIQFLNITIRPINELTETATAIAAGDLERKAVIRSSDEIGILASTFNKMTSQLRESFATLEQRVAERTRNLELAAKVGRTVSQVRALEVMLTDAAELIRTQFDLYYVQVYLTNPSQTYLNLQAGTGTVGTELLSRNHRLPLNTGSINGRAAIEKKSVVISDTKSSSTFKPNPLLPNTRSEMAVPLIIGERVVGVLDMQSEHSGSLSQDVLPAFEALAGQLAIAIQNAALLAEAELARTEVEAQAQRLSRSNWAEYLDAIHKPEETGFVFEQNKVIPLSQAKESQLNANTLSVPIEVTGEALGNLTVEMDEHSPISNTPELVNTIARQVAQHIESLRLLESAERFRMEAEAASRRIIHEGWEDYMQANASENNSYIYDLKEVKAYPNHKDQPLETDGYAFPLKARDEIIGKLVVQGLDDSNSESIELVNVVAERLGTHLEGLRLSNQTEQALLTAKKLAEREQALRQITSVVRASTDPATILRSAARELGTLLGRKTIVRLTNAQEAQPSQQQGNEPNEDGPVLPIESNESNGGNS